MQNDECKMKVFPSEMNEICPPSGHHNSAFIILHFAFQYSEGSPMSICYDSDKRIFTLTTRDTMYQMQIGPVGHLLHLYYGPQTNDCFD